MAAFDLAPSDILEMLAQMRPGGFQGPRPLPWNRPAMPVPTGLAGFLETLTQAGQQPVTAGPGTFAGRMPTRPPYEALLPSLPRPQQEPYELPPQIRTRGRVIPGLVQGAVGYMVGRKEKKRREEVKRYERRETERAEGLRKQAYDWDAYQDELANYWKQRGYEEPDATEKARIQRQTEEGQAETARLTGVAPTGAPAYIQSIAADAARRLRLGEQATEAQIAESQAGTAAQKTTTARAEEELRRARGPTPEELDETLRSQFAGWVGPSGNVKTYKELRSPKSMREARMAAALRHGYDDLYLQMAQEARLEKTGELQLAMAQMRAELAADREARLREASEQDMALREAGVEQGAQRVDIARERLALDQSREAHRTNAQSLASNMGYAQKAIQQAVAFADKRGIDQITGQVNDALWDFHFTEFLRKTGQVTGKPLPGVTKQGGGGTVRDLIREKGPAFAARHLKSSGWPLAQVQEAMLAAGITAEKTKEALRAAGYK